MAKVPSRRRQGIGSPRHPKRIASTLRHGEWVECYLRGMGPTAIAEQYGVAASTVVEGVTAFLARFKSEQAEELRAKWLARIEHGVDKVWPLMDEPETVPSAIAALVRLSKRASEITGMDKPAAAPVGPDGKTVQPVVQIIYETAAIPEE